MDRRERSVTSHYSDPRVARDYHRDRYGGPIGEYFFQEETRRLLALVQMVGHGVLVVDVGAGTGKLSSSKEGFVAVDRSLAMLRELRLRAPRVPLVVADAQALPFRTRSVALTTASRVLMHVPEWRSMVREACRVSRDGVVIDFPVRASLAGLEPRLWWLVRRDPHPPHRVFSLGEVRRAFEDNGFRLLACTRGFVLPYRLHRLLGIPWLSRACEGILRAVGLAHLFGSPAFAAFVPASPDGSADS